MTTNKDLERLINIARGEQLSMRNELRNRHERNEIRAARILVVASLAGLLSLASIVGLLLV